MMKVEKRLSRSWPVALQKNKVQPFASSRRSKRTRGRQQTNTKRGLSWWYYSFLTTFSSSFFLMDEKVFWVQLLHQRSNRKSSDTIRSFRTLSQTLWELSTLEQPTNCQKVSTFWCAQGQVLRRTFLRTALLRDASSFYPLETRTSKCFRCAIRRTLTSAAQKHVQTNGRTVHRGRRAHFLSLKKIYISIFIHIRKNRRVLQIWPSDPVFRVLFNIVASSWKRKIKIKNNSLITPHWSRHKSKKAFF